MAYTVKAVAELAGITVRALHHYDRLGVLKPATATSSGYRLYTEADLERLQQVLFFRELGFGLKEIKAIVDNPGFDRGEALRSHRRLLMEKQQRLERLIRSVDRTIDSMEREIPMDEQKMFEGFDEAKLEEYRKEARARWGSEKVDESDRRTSKYTKEDWAEIRAESEAISLGLAALMDRDPADPEVQALVERHYRQINERFYNCSLEIYRGLGDLYIDDARFTANYERIKPGLAQFMRAAMHAFCDRQTAKA
jgi:DNA-binding transcriptional MerR regulator